MSPSRRHKPLLGCTVSHASVRREVFKRAETFPNVGKTITAHARTVLAAAKVTAFYIASKAAQR
jgi:hypothetical protein